MYRAFIDKESGRRVVVQEGDIQKGLIDRGLSEGTVAWLSKHMSEDELYELLREPQSYEDDDPTRPYYVLMEFTWIRSLKAQELEDEGLYWHRVFNRIQNEWIKETYGE